MDDRNRGRTRDAVRDRQADGHYDSMRIDFVTAAILASQSSHDFVGSGLLSGGLADVFDRLLVACIFQFVRSTAFRRKPECSSA